MSQKLLFVLHLPPPVHGAAVMGDIVHRCEALNAAYDIRYVNLAIAEGMKDVGRMSLKKPLHFFQLRRRLLKAARDFRPDLVYMTPAVSIPGFLKDFWLVRMLKKRGFRLVLHLHNKEPKGMQNRLLKPLYRRFFAGTQVILLSEHLYPDLSPFIPRGRVLICPNGLEVPSVERTGSGDPRILFFSNIIRSKGVSVLLEACRILNGRGVPFVCELVGNMTPDYPGESLQAEIREKGLEGRVIYAGARFGDAKWEAFARADVFALPTYNDCFPLVLLEALGAGLPVVTTPEGGIPDIVQDGETGFLCHSRDASALADCLETLLRDPDLRRRMGEAARKDYEARFTRERFEQNFLSVIRDVV